MRLPCFACMLLAFIITWVATGCVTVVPPDYVEPAAHPVPLEWIHVPISIWDFPVA